MADSFLGRTIGKYRIDSEIGRGGMGIVYRGHQLSLNRSVAIKVLPSSMAGEGDFLQRFRMEAQVIAALEHDTIVRVYDVEEDGGSWFIIMELIRGRTLREVRLGGALPVVELCSVGSAVAGALEYAHQRGIVHRDVKATNIMITADGRVKLMDFGIARSPDSTVKTAAGTVLGTPEYMAPEQGRFGEVSPQTDIYSLGVVLFEMATGRLPFEGPDPFGVVIKHVSEPVPSAQSVNPSIPDWLESTIQRALAKMPDDRQASAGQLEAELRAGTEGAVRGLRSEAATPTRPLPVVPPPPGEPGQFPTRVPLAEATRVDRRPETVPAEIGVADPTLRREPPPDPAVEVDEPLAPKSTVMEAVSELRAGVEKPVAWQRWAALAAGALGVVLLVLAFWPNRGPDRPLGVGIPASEDETGARPSASAEGEGLGGVEALALGEEAHQVRMAFLLTEAERHLQEGNAEEALRLCDLILESEPEHERALELAARAQSAIAGSPVPAPVAVEEPRAAPRPEPEPAVVAEELPGSEAVEPAAPLPPDEPEIDPRVRAGDLWVQARRQKERKQFHSLRETLQEMQSLDPGHREGANWQGKVDRWIRSWEEDLRDDLDEMLDDLADVFEDRDLDDLHDLWSGRLDAGTRSWARGHWDGGGSLKMVFGRPSCSIRDEVVDFQVDVTIRRKREVIEQFTWQGRMEKIGGDPRFTRPLR